MHARRSNSAVDGRRRQANTNTTLPGLPTAGGGGSGLEAWEKLELQDNSIFDFTAVIRAGTSNLAFGNCFLLHKY